MKILGIDPGSLSCGYGLISAQEIRNKKIGFNGNRRLNACSYIKSGRIVMTESKLLHERLRDLYESLSEIITESEPDEIVIERMFFAKGIKSALSLGQARGVVLLAASLSGLPIFEYTPLEVKQAVVGYGRADKNQVQCMVREILGINHQLSSDGADALAAALCHSHSQGAISDLTRKAGRHRVVAL
ncbi:MAG TPA: crossover junction endodeoxyribonuclease RuvC [Dissulfurispiraceae bacterium]|nr:crossover junction endodeoxyribonuclease RuvC [Dissulfurispiraceae bacterium]